jgi:hypothetical protein
MSSAAGQQVQQANPQIDIIQRIKQALVNSLSLDATLRD